MLEGVMMRGVSTRAVSRMRELRRVFEDHGAEHKTISCYEAGLELIPENAQRFSRLHPAAGRASC